MKFTDKDKALSKSKTFKANRNFSDKVSFLKLSKNRACASVWN